MGNISRAFYKDLKSARQMDKDAAKTVTVTRLTKAGKPSKVAADTVRFATKEQAEAYVANVTRLNPNSNYKYSIEA